MSQPVYRYRADVVKVIDGDTYHLRIDLGFRCSVVVPVRLRGVNTPEMNTDEGRAARGYVNALLHDSDEIVVESFKDRRSFERWVCDVWVNGVNLAEHLIRGGYGVAA